MKILHIVPGSGGTFYCQNCLRDNLLVKALRQAGHDAVLLPMYLPMFADDDNLAGDTPVFFGAVNLYLKYRYPLLRKLPGWCSRMLDSSCLLNWAARQSDSTSAQGLEEMTLAMLEGEQGVMKDEAEKLISWLAEHEKPDVIHISNPMLLGFIKKLKEKVTVPVVCSLQDEDQWINDMDKSFQEQIWALMAEQGRQIDLFIAVSNYYQNVVQEKMQISDERISVVYPGIEVNHYFKADIDGGLPVIGYLSKISESLGFSILVDAFCELKAQNEFADLELHATGGVVGDDSKYLSRIKQQMAQSGWADALKIQPEFDASSRQQFLGKLTVLCVPVPDGEAFGSYILEAMAAGVPVVQPDAGAFPELVEATGGGIIYDPEDEQGLVKALQSLLSDPMRAREMGQQGRKAVLEKFTIDQMTENMLEIYQDLISP